MGEEDRRDVLKGTEGRVIFVDDEGDDEDDAVYTWVYEKTFFDNIDLPGGMLKYKAYRVVRCMDDCALQFDCTQFDQMKKKTKAEFQACAKQCKLQECNEDK